MPAADWSALAPDWTALARRPAFAPVAPFLRRLPAGRLPTLDDLNALRGADLVSGGGARIVFVSAAAGKKVLDTPVAGYEPRVFATGEVATRESNLHDLFNALAWLAFPRAKAALNRLHVRLQVERAGGPVHPGSRGRERDAATLFDESGLVVVSSDATLLELLRGFRWRELFVARRAGVIANMRFRMVGHALMEKALSPWKGVTAQARLFEVGHAELDDAGLDALIDRRLALEPVAARSRHSAPCFSPLPILGIPGWCCDNEDPAYYDDTTQFRPGRRGRAKGRTAAGE